MRIIEIEALENGAHRNQTGDFASIPEGWAVIPNSLETPNFPFGEITVEEINGVMKVTSWTAGTMPEIETPEEAPEQPQGTTDTATKADVAAVWDSMAAAYNEGVNEA